MLEVLDRENNFEFVIEYGKMVPPPRASTRYDMEALIHHFKSYTEGF
jgi:hypothetical protein